MVHLVKKYKVRVIRDAGVNPLTGQMIERAEEGMTIDATSPQEAHRIAQMMTTLQFRGQVMHIYINGQEHFDEKI